MNRDVEFERWLADWIESGPLEAPDRAIAFAIGHAHTHRQRRLSRSALWRSAMDRMHLTPVAARQTRIGWLLATVAVAVAMIALVVVGSGVIRLGGESNGLPAVGGPGTPSPTPTTVTQFSSCKIPDHGSSITVLSISHAWGGIIDCTINASDPRVGGVSTGHIAMDERADLSAEIWGTTVITNAGGTWEGRWAGTIDKGFTTYRIEGLYTGTGGYAGLEYRESAISNDATTYTTGTGIIRPVGTLITGTEACEKTNEGVTEPFDNVTVIRGVALACTDSMSDPRVSGTSSTQVSIDEWADQSADIWGSLVLRNNGGAWEGRWSGTIDRGYTIRRIEGLLVGTGAYAGLEYHFRLVSEDQTAHSTLTGTIEPAT